MKSFFCGEPKGDDLRKSRADATEVEVQKVDTSELEQFLAPVHDRDTGGFNFDFVCSYIVKVLPCWYNRSEEYEYYDLSEFYDLGKTYGNKNV